MFDGEKSLNICIFQNIANICTQNEYHKVMYISHIKLFNWKNFHECKVNLSERCFIIGANAAGKSNCLDALRFLRDITKQGGGLQSAVDSRGGVTKSRSLSARTRTDVGVEVILSDSEKHEPIWKYRLYFRNTGGGIKKNSALVKNEEVFDYRKGEYTLQRDEKEESEDQETHCGSNSCICISYSTQ